MKITPLSIDTLLAIGENLNIDFKRAGDGPKNPIVANYFHQIRLADELGSDKGGHWEVIG